MRRAAPSTRVATEDVTDLRVLFFRMGLDEPHINAWFGGMYQAFFDALARVGCHAILAGSSELQRADALVVPVGDKQDQAAARAMAAFRGPAILYTPAADVWFRRGFLARWRDRVVFAYGADGSPLTLESYDRIGIAYHHLPFGSDPRIMRPIGLEPQFDVVFAANARSGPGRMRYVEPLVRRLGRDRVLLLGPGWETLGYPEQSVAWGDVLNVFYNLGRVCVNVHYDEQFVSPERRADANNRLFDLAMAGCCQVATGSATVRPFFSADEVVVADTPVQFVENVEALLADPARRERLGEAARRRAQKEHSWESRAKLFAQHVQEALGRWQRPPSVGLRLSTAQKCDIYLPPYRGDEAVRRGCRSFSRSLRGRQGGRHAGPQT
jgi:hypothetical protein